MNGTLNKIYEYLAATNQALTELQIAGGVGLKKSPYTKKLLSILIEDGHVTRYQGVHGNRPCWLYAIATPRIMQEDTTHA